MSGAFGSKRTQSVAPPQTGVVGFADSLGDAVDEQELINRTPLGKGSYGLTSGIDSLITRVTTDEFICTPGSGQYCAIEFIPAIGSEWGDHVGFECLSFFSTAAEVTSFFHLTTLHGLDVGDVPRILFTRQSTGTGVSEILVRIQEDGGTLDTVFQLGGITKETGKLRYEHKVLSDSQIRIAVEFDGVLVMPAETFTFDSAGRSTRVTLRQSSAVSGTRVREYPHSDSGVISVDGIPKLIL